MSNSVSVRFYLDSEKVEQKVNLYDLSEELQNSSYNKEEKYIEVKIANHFWAHTEEFIPLSFQKKIRQFLDRITIVASNLNSVYGLQTGWDDTKYCRSNEWRMPVQIFSTRISLDGDTLMIVGGKNLMIIVKAFFVYCKHNGRMPDYQTLSVEQKYTELSAKYAIALQKINGLQKKLVQGKPELAKKKRWSLF